MDYIYLVARLKNGRIFLRKQLYANGEASTPIVATIDRFVSQVAGPLGVLNDALYKHFQINGNSYPEEYFDIKQMSSMCFQGQGVRIFPYVLTFKTRANFDSDKDVVYKTIDAQDLMAGLVNTHIQMVQHGYGTRYSQNTFKVIPELHSRGVL